MRIHDDSEIGRNGVAVYMLIHNCVLKFIRVFSVYICSRNSKKRFSNWSLCLYYDDGHDILKYDHNIHTQ